VSSTYRILCLNHDPAIVLPQEWASGSGGRDTVTDILDNHHERPVEGHENCDLIGGRFSYPLVEVYLAGRWTDIEWLRLARAVDLLDQTVKVNEGRLATAAARVLDWTPQRLHRLRNLLDPWPCETPDPPDPGMDRILYRVARDPYYHDGALLKPAHHSVKIGDEVTVLDGPRPNGDVMVQVVGSDLAYHVRQTDLEPIS
jgi:hypothetical protein